MHQQQTASENIEGKGEIARNEHKKLLCGKGLILYFSNVFSHPKGFDLLKSFEI